MNTTFTTTTRTDNLSRIERALRVAFGFALLGSVMTAAPGILGWTAVLALVAIYPILTGLAGMDPLRSVMEGHPSAYRVAQSGLTVALIGTVIILPAGAVGLLALLPLFSIYSALAVVLGRSPVATLVDASQTIPYVVMPVAETTGLAPAVGTGSRWAA